MESIPVFKGMFRGQVPKSQLYCCALKKEMAFKDLDAIGLYQALEVELGADIATVIRDEDLSGEDFLDLTEDEVAHMFSKLGQKKKVLRLIKSKHVATAEVANYKMFSAEQQH